MLPTPATIPAFYDRFQGMLFDSKVEDSFSRQVEAKDALRPRIQSENKSSWLTPKQRVEWALRLGLSRYNYGLSELKNISDYSLIDEGLRAYLEFKAPDPFSELNKWNAAAAEVGAFLVESSERKEALLQQNNAALWNFILGDTTNLNESWLLALSALNRARVLKGRARIEALLTGRHHLSLEKNPLINPDSFDLRAIEMLVTDFGISQQLAGAVSKIDNSGAEVEAQKISFLRKIKSYWQDQGQARLAADALSRVQLLQLESGEELNPQEILDIADLELQAGQFALAAKLYRRASEASKESDRWTYAKSMAGLAVAAQRDADIPGRGGREKLELAAEYFRQAIEVNYGSENCDFLLENYGALLSELGYPDEALKIFERLYKEAKRPIYKARGLGLAADLMLYKLSQSESTRRRGQYRRYLGYLSFLSDLAPRNAALKQHFEKALQWQKKLQLENDPETMASILEIRLGLRK